MIIKKVKMNNDIVTITLDDKTSFKISSNTYLNNHILIGEEISQNEIDKLLEEDSGEAIKFELLKKLSKKHLSIYEAQLFLEERGLNKTESKKIILEYQKSGFINDEDLAQYIIDYCLVNKKGRDIIKGKMIDRKLKGDYDTYINKYLDEDRYNQNIEYLIQKYSKLAKNKSNSYMKKYVVEKIISNGYKKEEIDRYSINANNDELENVKKEVKKFFLIKERNKENVMKITRKLLSKGFNYDIIKAVIGESDDNEIN